MSIVVIGCPDCGVQGEIVRFEGGLWFACHEHRTCWQCGNLASPPVDIPAMDLGEYRHILDPHLD